MKEGICRWEDGTHSQLLHGRLPGDQKGRYVQFNVKICCRRLIPIILPGILAVTDITERRKMVSERILHPSFQRQAMMS